MYIKLSSTLDIEEFVHIALGYPDAITFSKDLFISDAKCIFELNLYIGKEIYVHMDTQESDTRREFFQKISKWRVA